MIGYLRGRVVYASADEVVLDVHGVGYRAAVPSSTLSALPPAGGEAALFCHLHVREDALQLFGFAERHERDLFELLLTVSGVGPKVALQVLSALTPEAFRRAVLYQDEAVLQKVPGVGRKTAQRMLLELKDRLGALADAGGGAGEAAAAAPAGGRHPGSEPSAPEEAVEALVVLGYSRAEAALAVERACAQGAGAAAPAEQLVRAALRALAPR